MSIFKRIKHGWNAFRSRDPTRGYSSFETGVSYSQKPDRIRLTITNERSIIASVYNRIAIDAASVSIRHVRTDQNGKYLEEINDSLNQCLSIEPNLDQTPRAFYQDIVLSMLDEGYIAIIIVDADLDPLTTGSYEIREIRRAKILEWRTDSILVEAYNPSDGRMHEIVVSKSITPIIENPLYAVTNGNNSTLKRLVNKLNILDAIDRQSGSGKLNLIIQLPYKLHTPGKQELAEDRRKKIEMQLTDSKYGIAYIDATEKIVQLNRPIENNLLTQVEYLTNQLYSQLGLTTGVMDGTASEEELLNYNSRTIEPIVSAIADEMKRKWLTKTARSQGQSIMFFRDPFKLVPVSQIAEIADKFIRNEILSPNEFRAIMGFKPSEDPKSDELRNPNIAASKELDEEMVAPEEYGDDEDLMNDPFLGNMSK